MAKTTEDIKIPYPVEGVIRTAQLSDAIAPEQSVQLGVNTVFDQIGAIMTRKGLTRFATTLGGKILSMGQLAKNASNVRRLLAQVGNTISSWDGTLWTAVRTLSSATLKARYSQFLDLVYTVNGNATAGGTTPQTFDGTTYGTTNVSFLPAGDFIQAGYEGRVWVLDAALDRLYYSLIVTAGGVITTSNPCDYIEKLSPQDGESFTGVHRVPRALLIFKQNHIYRVYGANSIDPYPAYNVGTFSNESIVEAKDGLYFHHSSGFYRFQYDGQPQEISRRIKDFVNAIPRSYYENVTGAYDGLDSITWSIGQITVEGAVYRNCQVRYTISTQIWTIYDLSEGNSPSAMLNYDSGNVIAQLVGTEQGKILQQELGVTDDGDPIYYELITRWMSFLEMWGHLKQASGLTVNTINGAGMTIQYQIDSDVPDKWYDCGKVDSTFTTLFPNWQSEEFNRIRFRLKGITKGEQIVINGMEIMSLQDKGYSKN